jgi:O-antigen/teichoic acid export membrane protein
MDTALSVEGRPEVPAPTEPRGGSRRAALWLGGGSLLNLVAGLVTAPILARALGPEGRGTVAAVLIWPMTLTPLCLIGLNVAAAILIAESRRRQDAVVGNALIVALPVASVAALGLWLAAPLLLSDYGEDAVTMLRIASLTLPLGAVGLLLSSVLQAHKRFAPVALTQAVPVTGYTALIAIGLVLGSLTVGFVVGAFVAATVASAVVAVGGCRGLGLRPSVGESSGFAEQLRMGLKAFGGSILNFTNTRFDQVLLVPLVSPRQLGYYAVAVTVSNLTLLGSRVVGTMIVPGVAERRGAQRSALIGRALRLTVLATLLPALVMFLLAEPLVRLVLGPDFLPMVTLLRILLGAAVGMALAEVAAAALGACRRLGTVVSIGAIGAAVTVLGLIVLVPPFGTHGAAWTTLGSYGAMAIAMLVALGGVGGVGIREMIPRRADLADLAGLARRARGG